MGAGMVYIAQESTLLGKHARIQHTNGFRSTYAHMSQLFVTVGQSVNAGDVIGLVGSTGNSTAPHLHFAVQRDNMTYTDKSGKVWANNYFNPWLYVSDLYTPPNNTTLSKGWLWHSSLLEGTDLEAVAVGTLNMRQEASSGSIKLGVVPSNSYVAILNATPQNGYLYCEAWVVPDVAPPNTPYQFNSGG